MAETRFNLTHTGQGVTVFRMNEEQSALADEAYGFALVALTARKQLSALQAPFLQRDPGAARAEAAKKGESNKL